MKNKLLLSPVLNVVLFTLFFSVSLKAQPPVNYNDVGVIVNINSTVSQNIGQYFMTERNIPAENLIEIDVPTTEVINSTQFADLREKIEDTITSRGLQNKLNYLVTTKGVPLKINFGGSLFSPDSRNASVDAELMLILGIGSSFINQANPVNSNYYEEEAHFSKEDYGVFLVTRLTGYVESDVLNLIDNSGPYQLVNKSTATFVLDGIDNHGSGLHNSNYNLNLPYTSNLVSTRGWNDTINMPNTYINNIDNVIGYWSWGSNTPGVSGTGAIPNNNWLKGSIAETAVSSSARSFQTGTSYGQSLVADWIAEGVTGMSGFVYEPFLIAVAQHWLLFDRYTREITLDDPQPFNLAESFYISSAYYSWMQVVVGDPKTSIITAMPSTPTPLIAENDIPTEICINTSFTLTTSDNLPGNYMWFSGDPTVAGPPYDETHPLWLAEGREYEFTATTSGTQNIYYVNENFVGAGIDNVSFEVGDCTLKTNSFEVAGSFSVYPNPASNELFIEFNNSSNVDQNSVMIYDLSGRKLNLPMSEASGNGSLIRVDMQTLSKGSYIISLVNEEGYRINRTIIKD